MTFPPVFHHLSPLPRACISSRVLFIFTSILAPVDSKALTLIAVIPEPILAEVRFPHWQKAWFPIVVLLVAVISTDTSDEQ